MIRRVLLLVATGALMVALAAAGLAQENGNGDDSGDEQERCFLPEGCEISGDDSGETTYGGIGPDYIVGGAGGDALYGLAVETGSMAEQEMTWCAATKETNCRRRQWQ